MNPLCLEATHDRAIRLNGRKSFPEECCGFLLGRDGDDRREVLRVLREDNVRQEGQRHNRFTISPEAFMRVDRTVRGEGLDIVGFYHTHPDAPARPSQYDLEHAWPVYSYVILAVRQGEPVEMTCWVLQEDRSSFAEQPIVIATVAPGPDGD